jgi:glycosyltransferase involved in cell wall biosynthesis
MVGVVSRNPQARLILACGDTNDWYIRRRKLLLEKIVKLGIQSNISELGIVKDVAWLIASSDLVVIPFVDNYSIADRPLTVLEAMACGKPVIATKIGGIPEIIQNNVNGILVEPNDRDGLEKAICQLLSDEDFGNKIGSNAASHIRENYDLNSVSKKLEAIYGELLK